MSNIVLVLVLALVVFASLRKPIVLNLFGKKTTGFIISEIRKSDGEGTYHAPVVEYTAENGDIVEVEALKSFSRFTVGDKVPIYYLPSNYNYTMIGRNLGRILFTGLFVITILSQIIW